MEKQKKIRIIQLKLAKGAAGKLLAGLLFAIMIFSMFSPGLTPSHADSSKPKDAVKLSATTKKKVKVGVVLQNSIFEITEDGYKRGTDAEYSAKIAQYGLLDYTYFYYDNFTDLMEALASGQIDMTFGIAHTEERDRQFLFSDNYLGRGEVDIKVRPDDDYYEFGNVVQLANMKLGAVKGSALADSIKTWTRDNGFADIDITRYKSEDALKKALDQSHIDGAITTSKILPEYKTYLAVPANGYYVCFNKSKHKLKLIVDAAMNRILKENPLYFETIKAKNSQEISEGLAFTASEKEYMDKIPSGRLTVAAVRDDPPYYRKKKGKDTGIIPSYYNMVSEKLSELGIDLAFTYDFYNSEEEAAGAVASGQADILGMTHMDAAIADQYGIILTSAYSYENIVLITNDKYTGPDEPELTEGFASTLGKLEKNGDAKAVNIAVIESDQDILDFYLSRKGYHYKLGNYHSITDCLKALDRKEADCIAAAFTQATWILNQNRPGLYTITALNTEGWTVSGAVAPENAVLGGILSKISQTMSGELNAINASNSAADSSLKTAIQRMSAAQLGKMFLAILIIVLLITAAAAKMIILTNRRKKDAELIESQKRLIKAYKYDQLTGLLQRNSFIDHLRGRLTGIDQYGIFMIDIDNFRLINESYGHFIGDIVLRKLASNMEEEVGGQSDQCCIARYSGDEFSILAVGEEAIKRVEKVINRMVSSAYIMDNPGERGSDIARIVMHIRGAAAFGQEGLKPEEVMHDCFIALNSAKKNKSDKICVYSELMKKDIEEYNRISDQIRAAIINDGFKMVYQPKVDIRHGRLVGYEALVRMKDSAIGPGQFIHVVEEEGFINQVGRITTRLVIEQLAEWKRMGKDLLPVSVNYSSSQIGDREYVGYTLSLLKKHNIPSDYFELEITESLMMHPSDVTDTLFRELKESGIRLLMDDFGTGYSSLSYLTYIPVDILKLDKSFVDICLVDSSKKEGLPQGERSDQPEDGGSLLGETVIKDNKFISDIIRLAHDLGKLVIVEGVEEKWQLRILEELDCDMIQGYYFSKPLPPEEAIDFKLK